MFINNSRGVRGGGHTHRRKCIRDEMKKERFVQGDTPPKPRGMFYEPVPGNQEERTLTFRRRKDDFSGWGWIQGTCDRFFLLCGVDKYIFVVV